MSTVVIESRVGQYHRVERDRPVVLPNYTARRAAAGLTVAGAVFVAVAAVNSVLGALAGQPAEAAGPAAVAAAAAPSPAVEYHVAVPGDSLWSISDRYRGDVSRDRFVDALVRLNGSTQIIVGQAIQLP